MKCGAVNFSERHEYEPPWQQPDQDGYLDWEECGRSVDDSIHQSHPDGDTDDEYFDEPDFDDIT